MTVDTTELRTRARLIEPGFPGTAAAILAVADENDALRAALAAIPHAPLCHLLMVRDDEPCSCAKSAVADATPAPAVNPMVLVPDETSVTYLGVTRLDVYGPAGRVVGVLGLTGAHVEQKDGGRRLIVVFEQGGQSS